MLVLIRIEQLLIVGLGLNLLRVLHLDKLIPDLLLLSRIELLRPAEATDISLLLLGH